MRKAVVLAAGKSTRIASLAHGLPKPLIEINGEAILVRNLRWLAASGIEEAWINLHYQPELIRGLVGDGSTLGIQVHYSQEREILGTAGGVREIASKWIETFAVLYGDSLVRTDLDQMRRAHLASGAAVTIGLFDQTKHPHSGIAGGTVTARLGGRVVTFNEGDSIRSSPLVNAGFYLLEPEAVNRIPASLFYDFGKDLFPQLLSSGTPLNSHLIDGYCLGVDTPEAYETVLGLIDRGEVKLA